MTPRRGSYCALHHIRRRCPACDAMSKPDGVFPTLEVPEGTAEWLRDAARFYDEMGSDSAVSFVEWVSVDLREVA
jgi:hypothetical protein